VTINKDVEKMLSGFISEIQDRLNPMKNKCTIVVVVAPNADKDKGEYAIFGNLPEGKNKELVMKVAIDMCSKELADSIEKVKAMAEKDSPGTMVN
jgi:hypothetical protein